MNRILTTHAGSLIRPPEVVSFLNAMDRGQAVDEAAYAECLRTSVSDVVKQQLEVGLDVIDDGEMGKVSWITYLYERVSGLELRADRARGQHAAPEPRPPGLPGRLRRARRARRGGDTCAATPRRCPSRRAALERRASSGSAPAR